MLRPTISTVPDSSPQSVIATLLARFRRLEATAEINEAATRLQFINSILTDVLGWRIEDLNPEQYIPGGDEKQWIDYHLDSSDGPRLVVEAKRAGKTFGLPASPRVRTLRLKHLRENHGAELGDALRQAQGYCHETGTFPFVVTNGWQWVASYAGWPSVPAEKISAVVFYGLEDIQQNLNLFIELLSAPGLSRQMLLSKALESDALPPGYARNLNQTQPNNPAVERNYLERPIEALMRLCFDELTSSDHAEMLERCYVKNDLTEGNFARLEVFVGNTLPDYVDPSTVDRRKADDHRSTFAKAARARGEALLLIGKVGSGKSTFLRYALQALRRTIDNKSWIVLEADLLSRTQIGAKTFDSDRLTDEVSEDLLVQAAERYPELDPFEWEVLRGIYAPDIQREIHATPPNLRNAPETEARIHQLVTHHRSNQKQHLKRYLAYLVHHRHVAVTVVLDNVDRGTEEFEQVAFLYGQLLSREGGATVITALRDTTYYSAKRGGFLDVGQNAEFSISPPSFRDVVAKRFEYTRECLANDPALSDRLHKSLAKFPLARVQDFVEILSDVVLRDSTDFQNCIQALAGTNVRLALELLRRFCTSGNTDIDRLFREYRTQKFHQPLGMLVNSLMRGSRARYVELDSQIVNIFQVETRRLRSHFTAVRILQMLAARLDSPRVDPDVKISEITQGLATVGHAIFDVLTAIGHMGKYGLLLSRTKPEPPWGAEDSVRLAPAGLYYLTILLQNREYVANLIDDTVVYDERTAVSLRQHHEERGPSWGDKEQEKLKIFLAYLYQSERRELPKAGPANTRPGWLSPIVADISERLLGGTFLKSLENLPRLDGAGWPRKSAASPPDQGSTKGKAPVDAKAASGTSTTAVPTAEAPTKGPRGGRSGKSGRRRRRSS